jgi:hypothetical protein
MSRSLTALGMRKLTVISTGFIALGFIASIAMTANAQVIHHQCRDYPDDGDRVRLCVQEDNRGRFSAMAEVFFGADRIDVEVYLEQCRGNGTGCGLVGKPGVGRLTGHKKLASTLVAGAHGHSYRARARVGVISSPRSPFIAYP